MLVTEDYLLTKNTRYVDKGREVEEATQALHSNRAANCTVEKTAVIPENSVGRFLTGRNAAAQTANAEAEVLYALMNNLHL